MLSSALAELVIIGKVEKISAEIEVEKKDEDETEIQEQMQMSGNGKWVKKVIEITSDQGTSI